MAASYTSNIISLIDEEFESIGHDEGNWSLASTFGGCFSVVAIYLVLVLRIIPGYMKGRPPMILKRFLLMYNVLQVVYSLYLVLLYTRYMVNYGIIVKRCATDVEARRQIMSETWPYFIAKHIDLMDTVLFALRKKTDQVSFLHVYHHCVMLTWTWLHNMYHPTDQFVFVGFLNSFVHVLMYAYYAISSLGPKYSKYVWWKKHLTKVQLVQFILVILQLHFQHQLSPCPVPGFFHWFCVSNISAFFLLFLKFYYSSYRRNLKDRQDKKNGTAKD